MNLTSIKCATIYGRRRRTYYHLAQHWVGLFTISLRFTKTLKTTKGRCVAGVYYYTGDSGSTLNTCQIHRDFKPTKLCDECFKR